MAVEEGVEGKHTAEPQELTPEQKKVIASIENQDREDLEAREQQGPLPVNFTIGEDRRTPLHIACLKAAADIVKILLRNGADASAKNTGGWNALHIAAVKGKLDVITCLMEQDNSNLQVDDVTLNGDTAMMLASQEGHLAAVESLFDFKAKVNLQNKAGMAPLHKAALNGHIKVINLLLDLRANVNAVSNQKKNALHFACQGGHMPSVKLLIEQGLDLNTADGDGQTALHLAAAYGHTALVQYFVTTLHSNIEVSNSAGSTPLMVAAQRGHMPVAKELLKRKANVCEVNTEEWTAIHKAAYYGHKDVMGVLLKAPGGASVLDARTTSGCTALMLACHAGHDQIVKMLMARNADPSIADRAGWMPIHRAAKAGKAACLKVVFSPATKDATTPRKQTPLMLAASGGHVEAVKFLLGKKCDAGLHDADEFDAIRHAFLNGHQPVAQLIGKEPSSGKKSADTIKSKVSKKQKVIVNKMLAYEEHLTALHQAKIFSDDEANRIKTERKRTEAVRSMLTSLLQKKNPPQLWAGVFMASVQSKEAKLYQEIMK